MASSKAAGRVLLPPTVEPVKYAFLLELSSGVGFQRCWFQGLGSKGEGFRFKGVRVVHTSVVGIWVRFFSELTFL